MPFNDSNEGKEKKDSQRTRSGDCVVFVHLATQGDGFPNYQSGRSSCGVESTPAGNYSLNTPRMLGHYLKPRNMTLILRLNHVVESLQQPREPYLSSVIPLV
jgi:hypothetical protein